MKFWKLRLLTVLAFFAITTIVVYSACQVDACGSVLCQNGGACVGGYCSCPSGYEGSECQVSTYTKFVGTYTGNTQCDFTPAIFDTAVVFLNQFPLNMGVAFFSHRSDTLWNSDDTLYGTISNNQIVVNDYYRANFSRHVVITLSASPDRLNIYDQQEHITGPSPVYLDTIKSVCNFYGLKL